jgi:hypothetical protein
MTGRGAALVVLGAVAMLTVLLRTALPVATSPAHQPPAPLAPTPRPSPSVSPLAPSHFSSRFSPPAHSPPASAAVAAPFVQTFADQPGVRPQPALPSPTAALSVKANVDGCDHDYGTVTQCVPWTFPPGTTDKCAWLAAHGFVELTVAGTDRLHLDPDGDKIAC